MTDKMTNRAHYMTPKDYHCHHYRRSWHHTMEKEPGHQTCQRQLRSHGLETFVVGIAGAVDVDGIAAGIGNDLDVAVVVVVGGGSAAVP